MIAWVGAALAQECAVPLHDPPSSLSVAWVSPLAARVGAEGWLTVVPTSDLRAWAATAHATTGRLLQHLGYQRKADEPHRAWKVVIFDVAADELCRPLSGDDLGPVVHGVAPCEGNARISASYDGCGALIDRADDTAALPVFRARWGEAARDGFCVLPIERFLAPEQ